MQGSSSSSHQRFVKNSITDFAQPHPHNPPVTSMSVKNSTQSNVLSMHSYQNTVNLNSSGSIGYAARLNKPPTGAADAAKNMQSSSQTHISSKVNQSTISANNSRSKGKSSPIKQNLAPSNVVGKTSQSLRTNEIVKVQSNKSIGKGHTVSLSGGKNQTTPTGSNSTKISSGRENSGSNKDVVDDEQV